LGSKPQWPQAPCQIELKRLGEEFGGEPKSTENNLKYIARYITNLDEISGLATVIGGILTLDKHRTCDKHPIKLTTLQSLMARSHDVNERKSRKNDQ
jgi:hypothetical protein